MASKYKVQLSSIYIEGTDVPKNKLNIKDSIQIHELEKELLTEAYQLFYHELDEDTIFDENYFIELHRRTFEALYDWAGVYRDHNMAKGESRFCQGMYVASSSKKIFDELKKDNYLKDYEKKSKEEFAQKLAYYKCEIIALHPFYELNGRITRLFFDMIAFYNGYKYIDYSAVTPAIYINAAIECVQFADSSNMDNKTGTDLTTIDFERKTKDLIDSLKGICSSYGLGNDGNEFKIITQVFLYKFLNDKFAYDVKKSASNLAKAQKWETAYASMSENDRELLCMEFIADTAILKPEHLISHLFDIQNAPDFAKTFDDTLRAIAIDNNDIFAVKTEGGAKVKLFDNVSEFITDSSKRDAFCKAIINKLVHFSFENIFTQKYDFYATIFEYLVKDYNNDSGGKYAEYYTPHAVAKIMAAILVREDVKSVTCYDPSAGSGTLLMNIAHAIGEDKCTIYSQDISQKSSSLLRLNLVLNNLVHSIQNIIQGNTMLHPYHKEGEALRKFDYIVSNPPFKMDFSDYRDDLDSKENHERFFAGIPNVPAKKKESMSIYSLFLQHIIFSLKQAGKAAVVVPTGFITAQSGIDRKIREKLIDEKMLAGVVSMPSNIFATTGTNVSIVFIDRSNKEGVVLIDASNLGKKVKEGKNQKTVLSPKEEDDIINTFNNKIVKEDLSVVVSYDEIKAKNYSFSAGQYFDVKIEYVDITKDEFEAKMKGFSENLESMFAEGRVLEDEILKSFSGLQYD